MMPIENMMTAISVRAHGRFAVSSDEKALIPSSCDPATTGVCRLKRIGTTSGCRTILIASLAFTSESVQSALRWAAEAREQLSEPETADLYMFLLIEDISNEEATRIETDDRFCRKVVLRPEETAFELLDRTFLAALTSNGETGTIGDPLQTALAGLADKDPWTQAHLHVWRELLLSGRSGSELAKALESVLVTGEVTP